MQKYPAMMFKNRLINLACLSSVSEEFVDFDLQFDSGRGRDEWVSAWVNVDECEKDEEEKRDSCYFVVS